MKKKGKTIYYEDIYPSALAVSVGALWMDVPWRRKKAPKGAKFTRVVMPCMIFGWLNIDNEIMATGHQSLQ